MISLRLPHYQVLSRNFRLEWFLSLKVQFLLPVLARAFFFLEDKETLMLPFLSSC